MQASTHSRSNRNGWFTYRLYHLPFWLAYHYLWWVVALGNPVKALSFFADLPFTLNYSFYVLFQAVAVYINLYYLMPRYLIGSQYARYVTYLLLTVLGASLLIVSGYYLSAYASGRTLDSLYGGGTASACFFGFFGRAFPSTVASTTLAMSIKLTKNWVQTRQRQLLLEKEKVEAELTFLKNQINPHFLFNTINSIFFLIPKNPDRASASLAKFSDLLRYQLYECNDQQIPLSKEIAYLENFIELEKLRQNDNVTVSVALTPHTGVPQCIAPFILMTFVENAFKHVSRQRERPNWIRIELRLDGPQLNFLVANSTVPAKASETSPVGGIGLKNVQRRLDLVYPGRYMLAIQPEPNQYTVRLRATLSDLTPKLALQPA